MSLGVVADADDFIQRLKDHLKSISSFPTRASWVDLCNKIRGYLPLNDPMNQTDRERFIDPYELVIQQNLLMTPRSVVLPCSSGGPATVTMQVYEPVREQKMLGNKSLAAMGYGLAGAIGAAFAQRDVPILLNEGDGGFAQNLQELGTLYRNQLNVKVFLWSNEGYASIRMTQRNYFDGNWIGCDSASGLGLPSWSEISDAYRIPYCLLNPNRNLAAQVRECINAQGPLLIEVPIDPEQTYFPKISSRVRLDGSMESSPLHLMTPELESSIAVKVLPFL